MPIYEYECRKCGAISGFLIRKKPEEDKITCLKCGGQRMSKIISRVTYHRSEEDRLQNLDTRRPQEEGFYRDSRNVGLWAKKRMRELGVDPGEQFDEIAESARTGKILEKYGL
jgi:putative FmdB family regulatory protein